MPSLQFESFGSKTYEVVVGTGPARGTFYVRHIPSDTTTYRFVCCEGYEEYAQIKRAWRRSIAHFERWCRDYDYYPD